MGKDNGSSGSSSYHPYTINNSGTNSQGNSYDNRSQPGGNAYHYSNSSKYSPFFLHPKRNKFGEQRLTSSLLDGSYYYSNANGSTYYNNGKGSSTYTAPNGHTSKR